MIVIPPIGITAFGREKRGHENEEEKKKSFVQNFQIGVLLINTLKFLIKGEPYSSSSGKKGSHFNIVPEPRFFSMGFYDLFPIVC